MAMVTWKSEIVPLNGVVPFVPMEFIIYKVEKWLTWEHRWAKPFCVK
jgi:hypothetical protein